MPSPDAEAAILRDLAGAYPNITAIRVKDAIARVSEGARRARGRDPLRGLDDAAHGLRGADRRGRGGRGRAGLRGGGAQDAGRLARDGPGELRAALGADEGPPAGLVALAAGCLGAWAGGDLRDGDPPTTSPGGNALAIVLGGIGAHAAGGPSCSPGVRSLRAPPRSCGRASRGAADPPRRAGRAVDRDGRVGRGGLDRRPPRPMSPLRFTGELACDIF